MNSILPAPIFPPPELDEKLRRGRGGPAPARQARASFAAPRRPASGPGLSGALVAGAGAQPLGGAARGGRSARRPAAPTQERRPISAAAGAPPRREGRGAVTCTGKCEAAAE